LKFNQNKEITVHNVKIMPQNLDRPHYSEKWMEDPSKNGKKSLPRNKMLLSKIPYWTFPSPWTL
jgi:hypothetical protein